MHATMQETLVDPKRTYRNGFLAGIRPGEIRYTDSSCELWILLFRLQLTTEEYVPRLTCSPGWPLRFDPIIRVKETLISNYKVAKQWRSLAL
ncbi:uncharacterized protein ARMOST_11924 [Armillaria ostoyae]|uniref:Uncharacterized protein n=1 Tax=Armillaria ostoyae TaxID=47428 RepID=A0A284RIG9_ARMOS|nr:uncharacterized protein ARMOST_11924 [Armillaria ostoyae]